MVTLHHKGFSGSIENNTEKKCLSGQILGIPETITYEGASVHELKLRFEIKVDKYILSCKEKGIKNQKEYKINLYTRITGDLHERIELQAKKKGMSTTEFIIKVLEDATSK